MIFDPKRRKEERSARIGMALFRMSQAIKKMTQAESDALGLSPIQIQALLFSTYTRGEMATVGNFADSIGTTHVTAVKIINGLVTKGLMSKSQKPEDRRVTLLVLTSKGEEVVSHIKGFGHSLEEALQPISDETIEKLELGLGSIISVMEKRGDLVVAEPCLGCIHFRPHTNDGATPHYCNLIQKYLSHEASLKECPEHTPSP